MIVRVGVKVGVLVCVGVAVSVGVGVIVGVLVFVDVAVDVIVFEGVMVVVIKGGTEGLETSASSKTVQLFRKSIRMSKYQ